MKILLFGGSGQLGYEIMKRAYDLNFEVIAPVTSEVDITNEAQVRYLIERASPTIIINSAAYTAVDQAESDQESCFLLNSIGARNVAHWSERAGARCIYISTDYVFDGTHRAPMAEDSPVRPISVYGESKLEGERRVLQETQGKGLVVRTSSLFGKRGVNFVATMIGLFSERETIKVVEDQTMSPTWAGWLAESVLDLCRGPCSGVVHATCSGSTTWYQFARRIHELVRDKVPNAGRVQIEPTTAEEFQRPAKRPQYSVLDCSKLSRTLGRPPLHWDEGLQFYLQERGLL